MSLQTWAIVLGGLSAVSALAAAVLWWLSAIIKTPGSFSIHVVRANGPFGQPLGGNPLGGTYVGHAYSQDLVTLANALRRQSRRSGWAAGFAGLSAVLQAGAMLAQIYSSAG